MRAVLLASLALLALLCLALPSLPHSDAAGSPTLLAVAAAPTHRGASAAHTHSHGSSDSEDAEYDEEDDITPVMRKRAAQQQQAAAAPASVATDEYVDAESAPLLLRLSLQHAVDGGAFTPRGEVTLNFNPQRGAKALTFSAGQTGSKAALLRAWEANHGAIYRVRFVQEGQKGEDAIMASVQVCALAISHFHENFIFNVDPYGTLLSVSYRTPLSECQASEVRSVLAGADAYTLVPKAKISFGKPGVKANLSIRPHFDSASQAKAQEVGAEAPAAGANPEAQTGPDGKPLPPPQSFWSKYWIYIVPVGIFMLVQAVVGAPPEGAGGAGGAASAGAAPRAAAQ